MITEADEEQRKKSGPRGRKQTGMRICFLDALSGRLLFASIAGWLLLCSAGWAREIHLLNVSYDPTRELYQEFNQAFAKYWKSKTADTVVVNQSQGGSGKQARAVINGLQADIVTLALAPDVDAIAAKTHLLPVDWQKRLPYNGCPYVSTIVFLVRKGNPKSIKDWDDLARPGISVITPNPKNSGGARWNFLAAYGYELKKTNGDEARAKAFVKALFKNVPTLDDSARAALTTFATRGIGDVLIAWENEAILAARETELDRVQIVVPSWTILAEPPVAVVDENAKRHGTEAVARAYLQYLYTPEGQEIAARNFYRPRMESVMRRYVNKLPDVKTFTIDEMFGGWQKAQEKHFADGGTFDQIYQSNQ